MKIFKIFSNVNFYLLNAKSIIKNTAYSLKAKAFVFLLFYSNCLLYFMYRKSFAIECFDYLLVIPIK